MKAKQKRKAFSRALQQELKVNTKKTNPRREASYEHQFYSALDSEV